MIKEYQKLTEEINKILVDLEQEQNYTIELAIKVQEWQEKYDTQKLKEEEHWASILPTD